MYCLEDANILRLQYLAQSEKLVYSSGNELRVLSPTVNGSYLMDGKFMQYSLWRFINTTQRHWTITFPRMQMNLSLSNCRCKTRNKLSKSSRPNSTKTRPRLTNSALVCLNWRLLWRRLRTELRVFSKLPPTNNSKYVSDRYCQC